MGGVLSCENRCNQGADDVELFGRQYADGRHGEHIGKTRLRRALMRLQDQMRQARHLSLQDQVNHLNQMLRGHYAYYGIGGNIRTLQRVHRTVERYWRKMLSSRSWHGTVYWKQFQRIKERFPLLRPKLYLPYRGVTGSRRAVKQLPKSVVREIRTLRSVGAGGGRLPPATRCTRESGPYRDRFISFTITRSIKLGHSLREYLAH